MAEFIMMFLLFQILGDHGGASAMQAGTEEMVCEAGGHAAATCCLLHTKSQGFQDFSISDVFVQTSASDSQ